MAGVAIKAFATWAANAIVGNASAMLVWKAVYAAAYLVATAAVVVGLSKVLAQKVPGIGSQAREMQAMVKGTVAPRRVIYGTQRVGGLYLFQGTSGSQNEYMWYAVAIGATNGAAYEAVTKFYIDDSEYTVSSAFDGDGILNSGKYAGLVKLNIHLGADTQTHDTDLAAAFTEWTDAFDCKGVCYAIIRLERDDEVFDHLPAFSFLVQGAKLYDPRLDTSVGGSGTHRSNDASTWEYSNNPALCLADYIVCPRYGMDELWARIDLTALAASANICDETPAIPGSTTQIRYTCDGVLVTDVQHSINLRTLRGAMLGVLTYSRGLYKIYAGAYDAPTVTLTDSDLAGSLSIQTSIPGDEKWNAVRGNYLDASRGYQAVGYNPRVSSTYVTADAGETLWKDADFVMQTNEYRAQRMATVLLKQSRNSQRITGAFKLTAYRLSLWETVTLQITELGINGVYRVMGWGFNPSGTVQLELHTDSSAAWSDPDALDYGTPSSASAPGLAVPIPSPPVSVVVDPTYGGIGISWSGPADNSASRYEVAEYTASTPSSSATTVWNGNSTSAWRPFSVATTRYYWVRSIGSNGQRSSWVGNGIYGIGGTSLVPANVPLTVSFDKSSVYGAGATPVTTESITATAAGGSEAGYTYSWTAVSGDTTITANSASAATTTFNGTTSNDERVFKCTVDDSAGGGPIDSSNITVTIGPGTLTATLSTASLPQLQSGSAPWTTGSVTCTPTGGTSPYTYLWARKSGSTLISITSSTSASTTFSTSTTGPINATFSCTVTDSAGTPAIYETSNVFVSFLPGG